jgi:surface antigen
VAIDFAVSGYEQWEKDSHNPSLSEGKKVARATTTGAASAVGGYAGAKAGAAIGASIGVAGGPIGIAVGGVVGSIAGGVAGSWLGKTGANWFNNTFLK